MLLYGQTNTDFWFAAPEVTSGHGDSPIYLRLNSFGQAADVTVSEPSNQLNFQDISVHIAANSTSTIILTPFKEQIESKPPNTILNYGLHIHSTVPITAYYEEASNRNPEIFTFKGNSALGTSFVIPSQDVMFNAPAPVIIPPAYNSFDIIATEDGTVVTITPRMPVVGHPAGIPFQVILNKGQVYSAQATGQSGSDHLMGSVVTSDKPVCITVKDDSDQYPGELCQDLTGDQIVPVDVTGREYIVVRGYTNSSMNDWAFVTATADGTIVKVNGSPVSTLNTGETYKYPLLLNTLASYIETSQPSYVWHLTGYWCEAGTALLPPMNCTGSTQVAFNRTSAYSFELIILTKAGAEGSFLLDGSSTLVTAGMFSSVSGNPAYVYARIDYPVSSLPVGAHMLTNSLDVFHLGVIHTYNIEQSGCSYGYFSDFNSLNLGPDQTVCAGTSVTFDAGPNRLSYNWTFNGSPLVSGVQTITVSDPGLYSVTVIQHGCTLSDEARLLNYPATDVWLLACNDPVTTNASKPIRLKGGIPPGGVYGIDGLPLPGGILDPSTLSISPPDHTITYTYTNRFNCSLTKNQPLNVTNSSGFVCNDMLTDIRDQSVYPTFEIVQGTTHRCWMSANLAYGTIIQDNIVQTDNCIPEKYCPGNDPAKCSESGGFYQWDELMNYLPADNVSAEGMQGLCPPEWHVATEAEWTELENYYQGAGLAGWELLNLLIVNGFHAKTLGILYQNSVWAFMPPGFTASFFWTSTVSPSGNTRIYSHGLNNINTSISKYFSTRGNAMTVRCVKDK